MQRVYCNGNAYIDTDRGFNAHAGGELGLLGPNAGVGFASPEFSFFGFTFQGDVSVNAGVGIAASCGGGATVDKTRPNLRGYATCGLFAGGGGQVACQANVGIDPNYPERCAEEYGKLCELPVHKEFILKVQGHIDELNSRSPSTYWGCFWNEYSKQCLEEMMDNRRELLHNTASLQANRINSPSPANK